MRLLRYNPNELNCFSAPVMLATFVVEAGLIAYVWLRHRTSSYQRLVISMLLLLAVFQLAEYMICTGPVDYQLLWSRLGYVSITFLPPIGLHVASKLLKNRYAVLVAISYGLAAALAIFFAFVPQSINAAVCNGNYVIFFLTNQWTSWGYGLYYYAVLFTALFVAAHAPNKNQRAGRWMIAGYLLFIIPTGAVALLQSQAIHGVPSIMCGFAIIFAFILSFRVLPLARG